MTGLADIDDALFACPPWCAGQTDHDLDNPWHDRETHDPARVHATFPIEVGAVLSVDIFSAERFTQHGVERAAPLIGVRFERAQLTSAEARQAAEVLILLAGVLDDLNRDMEP